MSNAPSNTLGKVSLYLGIIASTIVFSIGLCAGVGHEQGWLANVGVCLFIVGGTAAFMGAIAVLSGLGGLLSPGRMTAIIGVILGVVSVLMFAAIVNAVQ